MLWLTTLYPTATEKHLLSFPSDKVQAGCPAALLESCWDDRPSGSVSKLCRWLLKLHQSHCQVCGHLSLRLLASSTSILCRLSDSERFLIHFFATVLSKSSAEASDKLEEVAGEKEAPSMLYQSDSMDELMCRGCLKTSWHRFVLQFELRDLSLLLKERLLHVVRLLCVPLSSPLACGVTMAC